MNLRNPKFVDNDIYRGAKAHGVGYLFTNVIEAQEFHPIPFSFYQQFETVGQTFGTDEEQELGRRHWKAHLQRSHKARVERILEKRQERLRILARQLGQSIY